MTKMMKYNAWIFQWFFFRVGVLATEPNQYILRYPVLPLSGWWCGYWPKGKIVQTKIIK